MTIYNLTGWLCRKKAKKNGAGDHDFAGSMMFIWAHGRSDDAFYATNELKYHGSNRGVGSIGAYIKEGGYKYPLIPNLS